MSRAFIASPETVSVIQSLAPTIQAARMFGVTEEQAAVVMLAGYELGLGMATAFQMIHVIDSKPSLSPKGALALIHQSGELTELKIEDLTDSRGNPTRCKVTMKRKNGFEYTSEFSMADAERAGIVKPLSGWEKYPANMLRWRAVGYCADVVFPDVIGGLLRPEELGVDVNADGAPIEGTWTVQESRAQAKPQAPPSPAKSAPAAPPMPAEEAKQELTVHDLLEHGFTAEEIMVANEGLIPDTSEKCQEVLTKLEAQKVEEGK